MITPAVKKILLANIFLLTVICSHSQHMADMPSLIAQYEADRGSLARFYVVVNSPERRVRFKKFNEEYLSELQQLNFDKLTTSDRVDYILLKRNIDNELLLLAREEEEYKQIATYIPFADSIYLLEKLRRRG